MQKIFVCVFVAVAFFGSASAESVNMEQCSEDLVKNCRVTSLSISPCPAALNDEACRLAKAKSYDLEFEFTTDVDVSELSQSVYWVKSARQELPWSDFGLNGCDYVSCPIAKNVVQKYKATIPIDTKYKNRSYNVKWTLSSGDDLKCCFLVPFKIVNKA